MLRLRSASLLVLSACQMLPPITPPQGRIWTSRAPTGGELLFELHGEGEPTLVFIHGWCGRRGQWDEQVRRFAPRQQVVTVDLVAGVKRDVWSIEALGADLAAALDELGLEQVVLVGHSMGAAVALEAARRWPEGVRMIVGVDTWQDWAHRVPELDLRQTLAAYRRDFDGTLAEFATQLFGPQASSALRARIRGDLQATPAPVAIALLESFLRYDTAAAVAACPAPLVCICGDSRPNHFESNRRIDADFKAQILPRTGHYVMLEAPRRFDEALSRSLALLE